MNTSGARSHRHNRNRNSIRLLEPLEARTLLSAAILVTGNGTTIANGDVTPTLADFTDFGPMSTTVSAAMGKDTRSYVIADTGDADLMLSGSPLIKITGANPADFAVTATAAADMPAGMQSGFTITFTPRGTGLRRATVTLLTNDPAAAKFTFNIQGTGLKTTNSADGLQTATTVKGTGLGAIDGTDLRMTYTGYLLDGTVFDSTAAEGGQPLELTLGAGSVIQGWEEGLLGIKAGESRALFIPAALGYRANAQGAIPANSPLLFTVTAVSVTQPTAVISGNGSAIPFNDKTPSAANGTFIGATPAGSSAPLSVTYELTNGSAGSLSFPKSPVVVLTNNNNGAFSTTDISVDSSGTFATFTVTYTPLKAGTQTAVVNVRSNDPVHPNFTFTVAGTDTPFVDLAAAAVGAINYPVSGNIVSGAAVKYNVPVVVSNLANVALPGSTPPVLVNFYLRDVNAGTNTLISSQTTANLRGLANGKSKTITLPVTAPNTIPTGAYEMYVTINENGAVTETNYSNNSVLSAQVVNVAQGYYNVNGVLSTSTFPLTVAGGAALNGKLTTLVRNAGNLALPANQKFVLQTYAYNTATDAQTLLGTSTITMSAWAPGKTALFTVTTKLPGGLPAGDYDLEALLSPVQPLTESSTADNLVTTTGTGALVELTAT